MKALLITILSFCLPFLSVIRISTYLYTHENQPTYVSLLGAAFVGACVLVFVINRAFKLFKMSFRNSLIASFVVMLGFVGYTTFVFSESNAKDGSVKSEFYALHPILRLAIGGLVIVDRNLVVTDMKRSVSDYDRMGLKRNPNSLHRIQKTGYAHAVDLRTNGRLFVRNWVMQLYFWMVGFDTLRHGGTGDHLHVSIPVRR